MEINLTNAYCPLGCCRLELNWHELLFMKPKKVRLLGVRDDSERTVLLNEWSGRIHRSADQVVEIYGLEINAEKTPWERWKR